MIKNFITCSSCIWDCHRSLCIDGDCLTCEMNYQKENPDIMPRCKCNLINDDEECPYYKEAEDD